MAAEEDVRLEVEAVQAVYGADCIVIRDFPPHVAVHIRPRTAEDWSQQFVEVILGIKASNQYPSTPPRVYIVEAKGLDESRQTYLIATIQSKALELSSCLMIVTLCEEAVEVLSNMNHPEGNCPLCLYPLVAKDKTGSSLPFMKLMSCYHCFHSECIIRFWKWVQEEKESKATETTTATNLESKRDQQKGNCPVCRKVFDEKDIEHAHEYLESDSSCMGPSGLDKGEDDELLLSESEKNRRQHFEALLKLQQDNNGLIEPRKDLAIQPGMFLPEPVNPPAISSATSSESVIPPTTSAGTGENDAEQAVSRHASEETDASNSTNKTTMSNNRKNTNVRRKARTHTPRVQQHGQSTRKQWIRKEPNTSHQ
ncbi:RWD [Musa troglodytarum]|uniref:RWD n=1 Tax=Musa troglodytarum TaxID=320322 RepID=A0A9E7F950_9LILI|nr:RWD [Musa troglodytarum]